MRWGMAVLRWVVGGIFMAHGAQKLFGSFGGPGLEGTAEMFEKGLGMAPGKRNALAAGASEFGGGALLVAGTGIPLATSALTGTMTTAVWKVHKDKGFFAAEGGYEFNLLLVAALFAIADEGPGSLALGRSDAGGPVRAFASLAAGVAGGFAAMELAKREAAKSGGGAQAADGQGANGAAPASEPAPASASA
jgi:putative oxidoreductase